MPASALIARYARMLRKLLPSGPIWDNSNGIFRVLVEALAVEPARIHESAEALAGQVIDPATATLDGLLPDYERIALFPDEQPIGSETEAQRRQVVAARLNTTYPGPNKKFWKDLGIKFGFVDGSGNATLTIQDGALLGGAAVARVEEALVDGDRVSEDGDAFVWQITFPAGTVLPAVAGSPVAKFQTMVERLKPAHTDVTYAVAS